MALVGVGPGPVEDVLAVGVILEVERAGSGECAVAPVVGQPVTADNSADCPAGAMSCDVGYSVNPYNYPPGYHRVTVTAVEWSVGAVPLPF